MIQGRGYFTAFILVLLISACESNEFRKTKFPSGLEYKVIPGKGGDTVKPGTAVYYTRQKYYRDSIIYGPYDSIRLIIRMDPKYTREDFLEIFMGKRVGDTIVTRIISDSLLITGDFIPPYVRTGEYLGDRIAIHEVITDSVTAEVLETTSVKIKHRIDSLLKLKK